MQDNLITMFWSSSFDSNREPAHQTYYSNYLTLTPKFPKPTIVNNRQLTNDTFVRIPVFKIIIKSKIEYYLFEAVELFQEVVSHHININTLWYCLGEAVLKCTENIRFKSAERLSATPIISATSRPRQLHASVFKHNIMCVLKHTLIWLLTRPSIGRCSHVPLYTPSFRWAMSRR